MVAPVIELQICRPKPKDANWHVFTRQQAAELTRASGRWWRIVLRDTRMAETGKIKMQICVLPASKQQKC
jgi:hypothetical protein